LSAPEPLPGRADLALQAAIRVLKRWIVVVSTSSLRFTCSISARFFSIRCDTGGGRQPRQGQQEVGREGQGYGNPEGLLHLD
jgi:hypothetical protein